MQSGGKVFRPMLAFATIIMFLTFLGLGVKFPGEVKTHLVG